MNRLTLFLFMMLLIFAFSVAAETKIVEKEFFKIVYVFPDKNIKEITIEPRFDNKEVTPYARHLQKIKVERNRRNIFATQRKVYIPDDCNKNFWQKHQRLHYCDHFKLGGKPWKEQKHFIKKYKPWRMNYLIN